MKCYMMLILMALGISAHAAEPMNSRGKNLATAAAALSTSNSTPFSELRREITVLEQQQRDVNKELLHIANNLRIKRAELAALADLPGFNSATQTSPSTPATPLSPASADTPASPMVAANQPPSSTERWWLSRLLWNPAPDTTNQTKK
jgi:hypothetical protein